MRDEPERMQHVGIVGFRLKRTPAEIVGVAEKRVGLVVTRLLGQQEVAIKSLGKFLANLPGIGGSTIMGDGRVALIVDPMGLIGGGEAAGVRKSA